MKITVLPQSGIFSGSKCLIRLSKQVILAMKLTAFLLLVALTQVSAKGYSQTVTISRQNISLGKVFRDIQKQTGYNFLCTKEQLSRSKKIDLNLKDAPLKEVLEYAFKDQPLTYSILNKTIIVKHKIPVTVQQVVPLPPPVHITGTVIDSATGDPLAGVTIKVKGNTMGTVTDANGQFSLEVPDDAGLVVSYLGYTAKEIPVNGRTNFNISLAAATTGLNQLVVVGYGTQKKKDLTGSVARANLKQNRLQPNINAVQNLRGTVAGVSVVDNGMAGSNASIIIRGRNSISGSNSPLIVLDGIIYAGSLSDINSNDIQSIDILKDASASAIYGSQAANGVILITTKKGTTSKPKITLNSYYGFSGFAHIPHYLNAQEYIKVRKDAEKADNGSHPFEPLEAANMEAGITIKPFKEIQQRAPVSNNYLSVSGKSNQITYYLSGSYSNIKSPRRGDNFNRLSFRVNLNIVATDWLKLGIDDGYSVKKKKGIPANLYMASYLSPYADLYYKDGVPRPLPMNTGLVKNPLTQTLLNTKDEVGKTLFTGTYADIKLPLDGLSYKLTVGYTHGNDRVFKYSPSFNREQFFHLGSGSKYYHNSKSLSIENLVKYHKIISENHEFNLTLLYGIYKNQDESSSLSSNNIFNDALGYNSLQIGDNFSISSHAGKDQQVSSMARLNYKYKDKYMATATIRRDGYSAFGSGHKFGIFPSIGVGWLISNEKFLSRTKQIDHLKIRLSWGKNGNRGVNRYSSLSSFGQSDYTFGGGSGTSVGLKTIRFSNPNLGWETTTSTNFGIDFGIFSNRISGSIDYYRSKTHDLLLSRSIPVMSGFSSFLTNIGATQNNGFELSLNTMNIQNNGFTWNSIVTFSLNRNKIVHLTGQDLDKDGKEDDDISSNWFIGDPLGADYDYVFDGIYQVGDDFKLMPNAKPGYIRFKDINGDGAITPEDRKVIGSSQPDFVAGITNTFSYKGFTITALFYTRQGGQSPNSALNPGTNFYYYTNILKVPYWTPDNPINTSPAINYTNPFGYGFYQSRSFIRLQNLSISYALPKSLLSKIKIHSVKVYISGKNLATWTKWKGWDPENGTGGRPNTGPLLRTYTFGLNINL